MAHLTVEQLKLQGIDQKRQQMANFAPFCGTIKPDADRMSVPKNTGCSLERQAIPIYLIRGSLLEYGSQNQKNVLSFRFVYFFNENPNAIIL